MIARNHLYWLAGLFDEEGCFSHQHKNGASPQVELAMSDQDTVYAAAQLMGAKTVYYRERPDKRRYTKPEYRIHITGRRAIGWMMTLYPLMSMRRRARIRELLVSWRTVPGVPGRICRTGLA